MSWSRMRNIWRWHIWLELWSGTNLNIWTQAWPSLQMMIRWQIQSHWAGRVLLWWRLSCQSDWQSSRSQWNLYFWRLTLLWK
ncbi:hypothetical protein ID866_10120 [Astraeus odoratus]|nr:hypothetical protein ID866_10120 [Astraeus odoratus]